MLAPMLKSLTKAFANSSDPIIIILHTNEQLTLCHHYTFGSVQLTKRLLSHPLSRDYISTHRSRAASRDEQHGKGTKMDVFRPYPVRETKSRNVDLQRKVRVQSS